MLYDRLLLSRARCGSPAPRWKSWCRRTACFSKGTSFLVDQFSEDDTQVHFATLRALLSMIERKDHLVRLLNEYLDGSSLTVVIGTEHVSAEMRGLSVVMSPYSDGRRIGCVGVIGPRRMRYSHAISAVDSVSRAVSRVFVSQGALQPDDDRRH